MKKNKPLSIMAYLLCMLFTSLAIGQINSTPDFTTNSFCTNNTLTATANATGATNNVSHWWGLMETSVEGSTLSSNTIDGNSNTPAIDPVAPIQGGTSAIFNNLDPNKHYYIKHGIWKNGLFTWREKRIEVPKTAPLPLNPIFNVGKLSCVGHNSYNVEVSFQNLGSHDWKVYEGSSLNPLGTELPITVTYTSGNNAIINVPLDSGDSFVIKHGMYTGCQPWVEQRKMVEIPCPDSLDPGFTFEQECQSNLYSNLTVTGNRNPCDTKQQYILVDVATGQELEILNWTQIAPDHYISGSFTFNTQLENGKTYMIRHGVWSEDCVRWTEQRQEVTGRFCALSNLCNFELEEFINNCQDISGNEAYGFFGIVSNEFCYDAIDYVEFSSSSNTSPWNNGGILYPPNLAVAITTPGNNHVLSANIYLNNGQIIPLHDNWEACPPPNLERISEDQIKLFPNPARAEEMVSVSIINEELELKVTSVDVVSINGISTPHEFSQVDGIHIEFRLNPEVRNGVHFVKLTLDNGQTVNKQLVVK